jgi:hypothetical protein
MASTRWSWNSSPNTELTGAIQTLTAELHKRLVEEPPAR